MLSVRSVILLAVLVCGISILLATVSLLQPPDSDGMGRDSYGVHAVGFRGLFEILDELDIPVERRLHPPTTNLDVSQTLLFLAPQAALVGVEPAYLQALNSWVERGGRLVIAPASDDSLSLHALTDDVDAAFERPDIFEILELEGVQLMQVAVQATDHWTSAANDAASQSWSEEIDKLTQSLQEWEARRSAPRRQVDVRLRGTLDRLKQRVSSLSLPGDRLATLAFDEAKPDGTISYLDSEGEEHVLVAEFRRGRGAICLLSDPALVSNRFLAQADNSVLALQLVAAHGGPVLVDEFYHGLAVRGNPLFLLTRPGFAAVTLGLLLMLGVWTWREAAFLGPPLPDVPPQRRDIGEYIDAMGRFFHRGRTTRRFLLKEVRDGVLHQVCLEVGLPPETHDAETIVAAVARRDPNCADRLKDAVSQVDDFLESPRRGREAQTLQLMRRMSDCL